MNKSVLLLLGASFIAAAEPELPGIWEYQGVIVPRAAGNRNVYSGSPLRDARQEAVVGESALLEDVALIDKEKEVKLPEPKSYLHPEYNGRLPPLPNSASLRYSENEVESWKIPEAKRWVNGGAYVDHRISVYKRSPAVSGKGEGSAGNVVPSVRTRNYIDRRSFPPVRIPDASGLVTE